MFNVSPEERVKSVNQQSPSTKTLIGYAAPVVSATVKFTHLI